MKTQPKTIVTLANNKKFIVVDVIKSGNTEYAYLLGEENEKPIYTFCTEQLQGDKVFLKPVTDEYMIKKLATLFSNDLQDKLKEEEDKK